MKNRNNNSTPEYFELFDGGSRDLQLSEESKPADENIPSQESINQALFLLFLYTNQSTNEPENGIALLA